MAPELISSRANPRFKYWKKQIVDGRGREIFLVSGRKYVKEAVRHRPELVELVLCCDGEESDSGHLNQYEQISLSKGLFRTMDIFGTKDPLLICRTPEIPRWQDQAKAEGVFLAIPFQSPLNTGAAIRAAIGLGIDGIVFLKGSASPWHAKTVRSSAGAVLLASLFTSTDFELGLPIVSLDSKGQKLKDFDFPKSFVLFPGIEGTGLPPELKGEARVAIPMKNIESYNAATAVSMALYEWNRR